ncbi:MAG: site-specific DNA-methyltransferase [Candidatus Limiplasma sp.]|nr:site-specific DNA-methyltransferase [Candidatus Limiplasma sp.]
MPTLNWIGKDKVITHHLDVPYRVLEHRYTYPVPGTGSENKIIRGDNLEALKALLPEYEGRVKCIYIDPPYNTGNEGWVYNDNVNDPKICKWLGEVVGREGEDLSRHDKWLCMIYPRLKLLQKLLSEDGVIFISIDDNEQAHLKLLCDEIFGGNNFVATIIWQKRTSPDARKRISNGHEYVLVYSKNATLIDTSLNLLDLGEEDARKYKNPDNDPRGPWVSVDFTAQGYRPNQMYQIKTPSGKVITPPEGRCWKNLENVFDQYYAEGRLWFGSDGNGVPRQKNYLSERMGKTIWTWWTNTEVGHTQEATQDLAALLQQKAIFDYPKPVRMIQRMIQVATAKDSIVLDSFAGSGTTAHAVLKMNKQDGGNRQFILVEMMDYAETITAERVRRVIDGYGAVEGTGGSFSFYDLGETLLNRDQTINEAVPIQRIREYVYYMDTKQPIPPLDEEEPYKLGVYNDTAFYFYYEKERTTTLSHNFLATIQTQAEGYIIYADINVLSEDDLRRYNITFKKIPRDIARL